ncbi:unknown [Clostridium sp. CAG:58]|nr:unknown [Clostridium sp. CAG:58]
MGVIDQDLRFLWSRLRRAAVLSIPQVQGKIHRQKMLRVHKLPACGRGGMDAVKILHHIVIICQLFHADPQPWKTASRRPGRKTAPRRPGRGLGRTGSLTFLWTGFPVSLDLAGGFMGLSGTFGSRLVCIFRPPGFFPSPGLSGLLLSSFAGICSLSPGRHLFIGRICRRCRFRLHGSQIGKQNRLQRCRTASSLLSPCRRDPFLHHSPGHGKAVLVSVSGDCRPQPVPASHCQGRHKEKDCCGRKKRAFCPYGPFDIIPSASHGCRPFFLLSFIL